MGNPFDDAWAMLKMAAVMPDFSNSNYQRMASEFPLEALQYLLRNDPAMNLNLDEKGNFTGADYFGPTTEGLRQGQGTRMVTLDDGREVEVPDVPPYVLANFDRSLSPETLEALRASGFKAHPKRLDRSGTMEYGFSMLPNKTRQMVEELAYRGAEGVPTDQREVTTNEQVGDILYNHRQTFGDNPRVPAKGSMRFQIDNPLTEEEQKGVAVLNRDKSTEKAKKLARENKTQAEIRREQMTGPDAERRAREAAEAERLIALDRQNESDKYYSEQEQKNRKPSEPYTIDTKRLRDMATRKNPKNVRVRKKTGRRNIKPYRGGRKKDEEEE